MFLFILESIGTSELLLIGMVALIVFGPRKIPEIARTVGKFMAEFRRSTDDFKKTWEREAGFADDFNEQIRINTLPENSQPAENSTGKNLIIEEKAIVAPEIKKINQKDFDTNLEIEKNAEDKMSPSEKRNWI